MTGKRTVMSRLVLPLALCLSLCLALVGCTAADEAESAADAAAETAAETGADERALPAFEVGSFSGGAPLDLSGLRGPAVVNFWASWCGPCRRELPVMQAFHERHPGVEVLGIDFQDPQPDAAAALAERSGATYPMYVDPLGELSGLEPFPNLRGLPYTALIDEKGRLAHGEFVEIADVEQLEQMVREHLSGAGLS